MNETLTGVIVGAILAGFLYQWGLGAMLVALLFMLIGGALAKFSTGHLDVRGALEALLSKTKTTSD